MSKFYETNFSKNQFDAHLSATKFFRLHSTETMVYPVDNTEHWIVLVPSIHKELIEVKRSGAEIERLIFQGILIPDIISNEEYVIQRAIGSVDHRIYRLPSEVAAQYQFPYDVQMILNRIENLISLCDYNIVENFQTNKQQINGQKWLEIIPRDDTVVRDYQNNILPLPSNEYHYIDRITFDTMRSRGIIVLQGTTWRLSKNYWEFKL